MNQTVAGTDPQTLPQQMQDIIDIRPPLAVEADFPWLWAAFGLLTVAAIVFVFWWWKRRNPKVKAEPVFPPREEALSSLKNLALEKDLPPRRFYFQLSEILRKYIEREFGLPALEMTTEELVSRLEELPASRDILARTKSFLRAMDPVKYGGEMASEQKMKEDVDYGRGFVMGVSRPNKDLTD